MPCIVAGDAAIPVARYGSSNVGRMKTVYRYGLGTATAA
jgi:glutamate--cysteine ligase